MQGVVCGIITVGDPHYITHRQNMDQLNFLMADMGVNQEVTAMGPHASSHPAPHLLCGAAGEDPRARVL